MKNKVILFIVCILSFALLLVSCGAKNGQYKTEDNVTITVDGDKITEVTTQNGEKTTIRKKNVKVLFDIENIGSFVMELYPEYAPETVSNFLNLVDTKFYNGLIFHRVIPGFMAQGGDPEGTGRGGSDKTIKGEFANNGFSKNTLKHERGTVSMARTNDPDSASSQFFICFEDVEQLDGDYAAFGKVVYGMDTVDEIGGGAMDENDKPLVDVVIKNARIISDNEFGKFPKEK